MITCSTCGLLLPRENFYAAHIGPGSKRGQCRRCCVKARVALNKANPERHKATVSRWRKANPLRWKEINDRSHAKHYAKYIRGIREWKKRHPERVRPYDNARQRRVREATPPWADLEKIEGLYAEARRLTIETGIPHEIDHIIPLKGKNVSGLHIAINLQILRGDLNRLKSNRLT